MCVREGGTESRVITTVYLEVKGALRGVQRRRREASHHHPGCFAHGAHRVTFPGSYCHLFLLHFNERY